MDPAQTPDVDGEVVAALWEPEEVQTAALVTSPAPVASEIKSPGAVEESSSVDVGDSKLQPHRQLDDRDLERALLAEADRVILGLPGASSGLGLGSRAIGAGDWPATDFLDAPPPAPSSGRDPAVKVTIGHLEIVASPPPEPPAPRRRRSPRVGTSLRSYLERRRVGRR